MTEDAQVRMIDQRFCEAYSDAVLLFDGKRGEIEAMHDAFADLLRLFRLPKRESVEENVARAICTAARGDVNALDGKGQPLWKQYLSKSQEALYGKL